MKMLFTCTHGPEDPERATLPFVAANVAAAAGQDATVVCTIEAVRLGIIGGADNVQAHGLPTLSDLLTSFTEAGGTIWLCSSCTSPRNITAEMCIDGATIVGAAAVVEQIANGAQAVSFA